MIAIIIGTRAELIKTFPVMRELEEREIEYKFIHTGQHRLGTLYATLGVKKPDIVLTPPPKNKTTKFWTKVHKAVSWNIFIIPKIRRSLSNTKDLDWVLYHGDTMGSASASIAASRWLNPFKKFKSAHLEAGLRSYNLFEPFPEEISRIICDRFSDTLFAVSRGSERNIKRKAEILTTGNTIVDSARIVHKIAVRNKIKKPNGKYALLTLHRHENITSEEKLLKIIDILKSIPIQIYFPIHDNTKKQMIKFGVYDDLKKIRNLKTINLVSYIEFIYLLSNSTFVLTDGGSVQEESLIFKKPCLLLRKKTERQEGLKTGINFLTKLDPDFSRKIIKRVMNKNYKIPKFKNPYEGDGNPSKKIVDFLISN